MRNYTLSEFEASVERSTGLRVDYLRSTPISEIRRYAELKHGAPLRVTGVVRKIIEVLGEKITVLDSI